MDGFNYFAAVSMTVSFFSLMVVIVQLGELIKQRRAEAVGKIFDINRQLITLGFSNPELFGILHDEPGSDPRLERAYLQLWLNQIVQIFYTQQRGFLAADLRVSLEADARDLLKQENLQRHWRLCRQFYPASFQTYLDTLAGTGTEPS